MFFKINSITRKWVLSFFAVIVLILIVFDVVVAININLYFNNYAKQALKFSAYANERLIQRVSKDSTKNVKVEIRNLIENFSDSDKMIVVGLDFYGNIIASSNGIPVRSSYFKFDGKKLSLNDAANEGKVGVTANGERIMALTREVPVLSSEFSAISYIVSLKKVDLVKKIILVILILISLIVIFLVSLSGLFFIKFFVSPIRDINVMVQKIAAGKFKFKINKNFKYEARELYDAVVNMANELSNSQQMKNEFLSLVSHELRTPLTAIQGWSETVCAICGSTEKEDVGMVHRGMSIILKEVNRLSNMVEDLLDFSKIQGGYFKLIKTKMDLFAELGEVILIYEDIAKKENKTLMYNEQAAVPIIMGDRLRVKQVLINLLDNAIKYSNEGDSITVTASVEDDYAKIVVKDTGCGISNADISKITEKFYKVNLNKKGSGIGLSVVKEIVEKHGGKLKFESALNKGTTVFLEFPLFREK